MPKKTKQEWQQQLTDAQYKVTRESATERPFSGEYNQHYLDGKYDCICCGAPLFDSAAKFDAGCGWPSFDSVDADANIIEVADHSLPGRPRTEVKCQHCDAHLGHVFPDGPTATGQRYCINSVALNFHKRDNNEDEADDADHL